MGGDTQLLLSTCLTHSRVGLYGEREGERGQEEKYIVYFLPTLIINGFFVLHAYILVSVHFIAICYYVET